MAETKKPTKAQAEKAKASKAKLEGEKKATKADIFFPLANLKNKPLQRVQTNLILTEAKDKKSCVLSISQSYSNRDTVLKSAVFPTCAKLGREIVEKFSDHITKIDSGIVTISLPEKQVTK